MNPTPDRTLDDPQQIIAELQRQLAESNAERDEAQAQKAAIAEILEVTNSSLGDLPPLFDAILEKAMRLCGIAFGMMTTFDGEHFHPVCWRGLPGALSEYFAKGGGVPSRSSGMHAQLLGGAALVHVPDMKDEEAYRSGYAVRHAFVDLGGARTGLAIALRRNGTLLGTFILYRQEVRPFSDKQIALLQSFAAQAVIAMENARLITETHEALEQQTATAEVLGVINSSPGDLGPVFDAMLEKATRLCDAPFGTLRTWDGERFHFGAVYGDPQLSDWVRRRGSFRPDGGPLRRIMEGEQVVQVADASSGADYSTSPGFREMVEASGRRSAITVALRKDGALLGTIAVYRQEVRPFSDKQIALLENFAAQAVIAMENARLITETREALEQQTATAEVLGVINSSPGDLAPVFDSMLERAVRLCALDFASLWTYDGTSFCPVAKHRVPEPLMEYMQEHTPPAFARLVGGDRLVHVADVQGATNQTDFSRNVRRLGLDTVRSILIVPLRKDETLLGLIAAYRREVGPFSDKQIALLENFAAQAVIAMENARLITETREALEQQTATAEVLGVINSSPGDLVPVFEAMLDKAMRLCGANFGLMNTYDGEHFHHAADHGVPAAHAKFRRDRGPTVYGSGTTPARLVAGESLVHTIDLMATEPYEQGDPARRALVDLGGARSHLTAALRKGDILLGDISIYRQEVRPFTDKQIALLQNFAAQAVIAMENARLINETHEALEQQTATADVLQVINASPGNLTPVFDAMLEKATVLCGAAHGNLWTYDGERFHPVATHGSPGFAQWLRQSGAVSPAPGSLFERMVRGERFVQIADAANDNPYLTSSWSREVVEITGARTVLVVPLRKDRALLGAIFSYRQEVRPFTDKEIALLENFAAQAVIAMENARLITETREALEQQTATAEVLGVINSSPGDLVPVFDAILEKAHALCGAAIGSLRIIDGDRVRSVAVRNQSGFFAEQLRKGDSASDAPATRALLGGAPFVHIPDVAELGDPVSRRAVERGGIRTLLAVPLRKDETLLGAIFAGRPEVRPFSDKQIALLQNFAIQAVIAMENARLINETRQARDDAEKALRELKAAQANLIQAEKMASLGQLTAGIAHEIKNPLNFVNNFADLSVELLDELKETTAPAVAALGDDKRAEVDETIGMLTGNLEKIAEHGRRADGIVKSMLEHSRGSSGERRIVDLNGLIAEALNLAYHGARAQDASFNITLERDFGQGITPIELVPQDITRVCLNLIGNGFYAATKRQKEGSDPRFQPTLKVSTRDLGDAVEIRVRDNGTGIATEIKDKLFQPFFTTKPTGEGTGLGLSISYDIVTQEHGGTITVDSRVGEFTEFTIRLPRAYGATMAAAAS